MTTLTSIVVLLAVTVLAVGLLRRAQLPPVLAYLAVGILVGPYGMGWVANTEDTQVLAEFGVVFLLFTLGLEFSLPRLIAMKKEVLLLGGSQVAVTTLAAAGLAWLLGIDPILALAIGGIFAMSSTALVIKQLGEQGETNLPHGRLAVSVLLFQDIAVIPFLILIPALGAGHPDTIWRDLLWAMAEGTVAFIAVLAIGRYLLRPLLHEVTAARSAELFTLTVLLCTLSAAVSTHSMGLSYALGAFLAGMMLGETEFRHQVEADIRPFRDLLLGLFFITVGMLFDMHTLPDIIGWVALVFIGLLLFKLISITLLAKFLCRDWQNALRTGLVLAQGGEFSFALLALAVSAGLLNPVVAQVCLAAVLFSMLASPFIIRYNEMIAHWVFPHGENTGQDLRQHDVAQQALHGLRDHVLICGYGRVGQNIARFLEEEGQDYIALDLDSARVRKAREAGDPVYYGDYTNRDTLRSAGVERARVVVATYFEPTVSLRLLQQVRKICGPDMPVLIRTRDDSRLEDLQAAGATEVVPETLEASLMLASHLLLLLNVPMRRIVRKIQDVRDTRYSMLRSVFRGQDAAPIDKAHAYREQLQTIALPSGARAIGKALADLQLNEKGISVMAVRRDGILGKQPAPDMLLKENDVLVLYGKPEDLEHSEEVLLGG